MAVDFRILENCRVEMGALFRRQVLALFHIFIILSTAFGSPVWMPQFLSGGQGRSIRHLPCVSRRTGEQGICMFAYTCLKSNGTHLGTCIDRFYFGSCCKLGETDDLLVDSHFPVINNNQVTLPYFSSTNMHSVSVQNEMNKITETLFPNSYPTRTTPNVDTSTKPTKFGPPITDVTDKTIVDLAQHLATETYFLTPSTEKYFVPVHTSKPNRTDVFATVVSTSGVYGRPTESSFSGTEAPTRTTPPYLLSTFQVVHNQGSTTPPKTTFASAATTKKPASKPVVSTWPPQKPDLTTPASVKRNTTDSASKPTYQATTKKPVKPLTTTRKPPTKKPVTTATKPATVVKITTQKPTTPVKKPTQPTKKPPATKPSSTKPTSTKPANTARPATSAATTPRPTTTTSRIITKKPTTAVSTINRFPVVTTYVDTTSEVVFTKPGITSASNQTPGYGITTFRPDLGGTTSKPASVGSSGLTTFSYVSEGVRVTTVRPPETTTTRYRPTKPAYSPTISNEITSSHFPGGNPVGGASEAQEENTNIIFQQVGSTLRPGSPVTVTSSKPVDTSVPFFPDTERPGIPTQWIEMVQTSVKPESPYSPPATTTASTAVQPSTVMAIFDGLNQTDYTQVCGRRIYPQARVVGGEKSTFGKWPWQISLRQWRTSTYLHKCGAALLNENWAITAAHCVENVPPSDLLLRLGEHDLSTEDEPFGFQERRVQIVASHPQFDPRTFEYDLALLRFYEPVKFQPNIIPVCVPEDNTNFVGQTAYVTGWGRLYEDGPLPSVLQEVSVPVINNTLCENMYRSAGYIEHIPEIFICAGWKKGGFDSCEGDSGGPMVIQRPDKRWLLAGVISWGIGCAEPNQPGVYTRISEFREWIHQILQF